MKVLCTQTDFLKDQQTTSNRYAHTNAHSDEAMQYIQTDQEGRFCSGGGGTGPPLVATTERLSHLDRVTRPTPQNRGGPSEPDSWPGGGPRSTTGSPSFLWPSNFLTPTTGSECHLTVPFLSHPDDSNMLQYTCDTLFSFSDT